MKITILTAYLHQQSLSNRYRYSRYIQSPPAIRHWHSKTIFNLKIETYRHRRYEPDTSNVPSACLFSLWALRSRLFSSRPADQLTFTDQPAPYHFSNLKGGICEIILCIAPFLFDPDIMTPEAMITPYRGPQTSFWLNLLAWPCPSFQNCLLLNVRFKTQFISKSF
jgi:hypothetical protein